MTKTIEVVPYDQSWPRVFESEAELIKKVLGGNCIEVYHIGSTAVPGLASKPKIDIIAVVQNGKDSIASLGAAGYNYRGEWNIPFKFGFTKRDVSAINLHVFEEGHPEIELNLSVRDYLRSNQDVRDRYAALKYDLILDEASHQKNGAMYVGYTLGKNDFIQQILKEVGFNRLRFLICTHYVEWDVAKHFRQKYFFDQINVKDPYEWTFNHNDHKHLILYQGTDIVGYAHIQLWPESRAILRIIVIDEDKQKLGLGGHFLGLIEKWMRLIGIVSLHMDSSKEALPFYKKHVYREMQLNDPDGYASHPEDVAVGKVL
jgi:GrpB-like predicted nucleotidyltransferase (UPF0157 family)/GNAT superfamily N-acetyltransferase